MKILKIELVTELGKFEFKNHFNSNANPYEAMCNFESNNWKMLGESYYIVYNIFEDGTETTTNFKGINNSANLAGYIEGVEFTN